MTRFRSTVVILAATAALAGCGQADRTHDQGAAGDGDSTPPGVEVTAAPGVAFRYDYAFRLPARRIAAAQERHAAACEALGPARCRITGMRYLRSPENDVDAELRFSIAPELARGFGRAAIGVIESNEGGVRSVDVAGEDAGAKIDAAAAARNAATAERAAIDARIARSSGTARAELERRRAGLGQSIRDADMQAAGQRAMLNATPMLFRYDSGEAAPGFEPPSPLARAGELLGWSAGLTFTTLLNLLGVLLPPMLLAAIMVALFAGGRRLARRRAAPVA